MAEAARPVLRRVLLTVMKSQSDQSALQPTAPLLLLASFSLLIFLCGLSALLTAHFLSVRGVEHTVHDLLPPISRGYRQNRDSQRRWTLQTMHV